MNDSKVCADCARPRDKSAFIPHPGNPDGLASRCRQCALSAVVDEITGAGELLHTKPASERYRKGSARRR